MVRPMAQQSAINAYQQQMTDVAWESRGAFKTASKDTVFLVYSLTAPPSVKAASEFTRRRVAALLLKFSFLNGVWGPTNVSYY
jgi:hypothetical protein